MTSYSDNAYDITDLFCCFEKFLAYTLFLPSFIVVRHQMVELNRGAFLPPLVHYRGMPDPVQNRVKEALTLKIRGLILGQNLLRFYPCTYIKVLLETAGVAHKYSLSLEL